MNRKLGFILLLFITFMFSFPAFMKAEQEMVGFSVKALIPENQIDRMKNYFDLRMAPGQQQEVEVVVYNQEPDEIVVKTAVHNAATNQNGLVVYHADSKISSSLKLPLTEIMEIAEEEIAIPAGESKKVKATITMPEEEFNGIILGGLHFEKVIEEEATSEAVQIQNKYAYVIGVQLSENDEAVEPELNLNGIEPKLVNGRTAMQATIQNVQPVFLENLKIEAKVYRKGEDEPIRESAQEVNMAPNSDLEFVIDWENERLKPGDYLLDLKVDDGEKEWTWEEAFTIGKEAKTINKNAVEIEEDYTNWYIAGVAVLVIIIVGLVWYIRKLKRRIEE